MTNRLLLPLQVSPIILCMTQIKWIAHDTLVVDDVDAIDPRKIPIRLLNCKFVDRSGGEIRFVLNPSTRKFRYVQLKSKPGMSLAAEQKLSSPSPSNVNVDEIPGLLKILENSAKRCRAMVRATQFILPQKTLYERPFMQKIRDLDGCATATEELLLALKENQKILKDGPDHARETLYRKQVNGDEVKGWAERTQFILKDFHTFLKQIGTDESLSWSQSDRLRFKDGLEIANHTLSLTFNDIQRLDDHMILGGTY